MHSTQERQAMPESTVAAPAGGRELPALGHQEYWYPLLASHQVARRPVAVRALGHELVLFRSEGQLSAFVDRCPHRGARLSQGRMLFPGTLSCGYHGWTFNRDGQCLASIVEGPESGIAGKARVRTYPIQERFGIVWVYFGLGQAPPLDEDLPPELLEPNALVQFYFEDWSATWRNITENFVDSLHTIYVHRGSLMMLLDKVPAWGKLALDPLPDGKGINIYGTGGAMQADYPGLGRFPRRSWWRIVTTPRLGRGYDVRMPGYIVLRRPTPFLKFRTSSVQWPVPIDKDHTRVLTLYITYPRNALVKVAQQLWYTVYFQWLLKGFVGQDKALIENQRYRDPEKLSASDTGIIHWRRLAATIERAPREADR